VPGILKVFIGVTPGLANFVVRMLPFFNAYAVVFVAFPLVRLVLNWRRNRQINSRNLRRNQSAIRLQLGQDPVLDAKLRIARAEAKARPVRQKVRQSDIVFDSSAPLDSSREAQNEFDKRLDER